MHSKILDTAEVGFTTEHDVGQHSSFRKKHMVCNFGRLKTKS